LSRPTKRSALLTLSHEVRGWQADQEIFDSAVAELAGLNRTAWRCLDILGTRGPMTAGQLAQAAHLTTGAVTAIVDQLEAEGLARRERDRDDRRRVILEVTDEVRRRGAPVYGPLIADSAKVLGGFDVAHLEVIVEFIRRERALLAKHTERVHKMLADRPAPERTS
jgi:DNA-binding MarR family transcriptional regulator